MDRVVLPSERIIISGNDHVHNLHFQKAINPGTQEDFEKEMKIFYPDNTKQFEGLKI